MLSETGPIFLYSPGAVGIYPKTSHHARPKARGRCLWRGPANRAHSVPCTVELYICIDSPSFDTVYLAQSWNNHCCMYLRVFCPFIMASSRLGFVACLLFSRDTAACCEAGGQCHGTFRSCWLVGVGIFKEWWHDTRKRRKRALVVNVNILTRQPPGRCFF